MPKINKYLSELLYAGEGSGDGSLISINKVPFFGPSCGTGGWYDENYLACQYYNETQHPIFILIHKDTKERITVLNEGATGIVTGGRRWYCQTLTHYLLDGTPTERHAYCFGLDGTLVWHPFSGLGLYIEDKQITPHQVNDVTYLENNQVVYMESGKIKSNIPGAIDIVSLGGPGEYGNLRAYWWNSNLWVMYQWYNADSIVTHPYDNYNGYLLGKGKCYGPDAHVYNGKPVYLWSVSPAFQAHHIVEFTELGELIDLRTLLMEDSIVAIGKPCWLTWFEFNQPPPTNPPGNALVKIRYDISGSIVRLSDSKHFANWVDGTSVEEIEDKVNASKLPCVAYWDGRDWPYYPTITSHDWLALQAYCRKDESPKLFESNMRMLIEESPYNKIALVCQCYTSNASLTADLKGLVPVYARLARDYPQIDHLLVFSHQDRATGLNDHPELEPYWKELFSGITGEPEIEEPDMEIEAPNEIETVRRVMRQHPEIDTTNEDERGKIVDYTCVELNPANEDKPWGRKARNEDGSNKNTDGLTYFRTDGQFEIIDVISGVDGSATWDHKGIFEQGENGYWAPHDPVEDVDPIPDPGPGEIAIIEFDPICKRSDPNGCLIRFDIYSPNPVVEAEFDLEGDGEPGIPIFFSEALRQDGRYVRGFAFKFTVNGKWVLRVTAKDNKGNFYRSNGQQIIEVIP